MIRLKNCQSDTHIEIVMTVYITIIYCLKQTVSYGKNDEIDKLISVL